ncbi:hypothetical protein [Corynebacterium pseudotuberculosis]|nr:hypothetical protein [Corynebacterium pseudotuberculosis]AEX38499.1 Hypothetical protein Cp3995_0021 [Corynebacterium pseudotuberculosis 3/99-5]AIG06375.1 hypothetical protein CPTA_00546 [Corynebacterium pseudotuberculosis]AIG09042.1 hypothetical protein CPTB_00986 [Corynebacterium pseudotuberculosis]AIG10937.1 hypothetical protein CPTC_00649 [Corynebacterium pseudotuberculosis]AJC12765.1 hypothetical protein CpVD57_0026 [Corynebacterium pseudotuberculosis]
MRTRHLHTDEQLAAALGTGVDKLSALRAAFLRVRGGSSSYADLPLMHP